MDPRTVEMLEKRRAAAAETANQPPPDFNTKAMAWLQKNRTQVGTVSAVLVGILLVGQYLFVTAPARRQERQVAQAQADGEAARVVEEGLQACMANAEATHAADIDKACKAKKEGANCSLPRWTAEQIDQRRLDARIDCIKGYAPK